MLVPSPSTVPTGLCQSPTAPHTATRHPHLAQVLAAHKHVAEAALLPPFVAERQAAVCRRGTNLRPRKQNTEACMVAIWTVVFAKKQPA